MKIYAKSAAVIGLALVLVTTVAAAREATPNWQALVSSPQYPTVPSNNIILVSQLAGTGSTVAVQGDYAYIGEENDLVVVDIKDPASPVVLSKTPLPLSTILDMAVGGNHIYITSYHQPHNLNQLYCLDITDPENPEIISSLDLHFRPQTFVVAGNYVYIITEFDLSVIDVTDPYHPELIGRHSTEMWSYDIAIHGPYAYIAFGFVHGSTFRYGGMEIFDIRDPAAPKPVGGYGTNYQSISVATDRNYAYLAAGEGLYSLDITNPVYPKESGIYQPGYFFGDNLVVVGQYLYGINIRRGLFILDISNPADLQVAGFYEIDLWLLDWDMDVAGGYAFIAYKPNGLIILRYTGDDWDFSSFEPAWGSTGTEVTLIGFRFGEATAVKFNGVAADFSIVSNEMIKTFVPPDATTGMITVETPSGFATSKYDFIVGNLSESSYFPVVER